MRIINEASTQLPTTARGATDWLIATDIVMGINAISYSTRRSRLAP